MVSPDCFSPAYFAIKNGACIVNPDAAGCIPLVRNFQRACYEKGTQINVRDRRSPFLPRGH